MFAIRQVGQFSTGGVGQFYSGANIWKTIAASCIGLTNGYTVFTYSGFRTQIGPMLRNAIIAVSANTSQALPSDVDTGTEEFPKIALPTEYLGEETPGRVLVMGRTL